MATQAKLTIKQGQKAFEIVTAAGSVIAGHDAISVNIDREAMTHAEAVAMLTEVRDRVAAGDWPIR